MLSPEEKGWEEERGIETVGGAVLGPAREQRGKERPGKRCYTGPWGVTLSRGELNMTFLNLSIFSIHKRKFSMRKKPKHFLPRNQDLIGVNPCFSLDSH